tara:strand:+ start:7274 stop:8443 length:1170 start_codon:yes stop_codon:yes gene_type:complete
MSSSYRYDINNNIVNNFDLYLIGNPQITYFSSVYRRHTGIKIKRESKVPTNSTDNTFSTNNKINADLIKSISLELKYNGSITDNNFITEKCIDYIQYKNNTSNEIIELLYGEYIEIYNQLRLPLEIKSEYTNDGVKVGNLHNIVSHSGGVFKNKPDIKPSINAILPVPFSFSKHIGNSIPLCSSESKIDIEFKVVLNNNIDAVKVAKFIVEYIILDEDEKKRFKNSNNEYIYEKVYKITTQPKHVTIPSNEHYNNIKSIIWKTPQRQKYGIKINNIKLFTNDLSYRYFTRIFPMKAGLLGSYREQYLDGHTNGSYIQANDDIHYYTFGLKEDVDNDYTPNGHINANINRIELRYDTQPSEDIYIVTYNRAIYKDQRSKVYEYISKNYPV